MLKLPWTDWVCCDCRDEKLPKGAGRFHAKHFSHSSSSFKRLPSPVTQDSVPPPFAISNLFGNVWDGKDEDPGLSPPPYSPILLSFYQ